MKKSIAFILFCALGFAFGYLLGVPFNHPERKPLASGKPLHIEEHGGNFVTLTPQANESAKSLRTPRPPSLSNAASPINPATAIGKLSLPEVLSRLDGMNGMEISPETEAMEQLLVNRWSKLDPIGAAEYAADSVAQGGNPKLLQTAAASWAKSDPAGAAQWAAALDSPLARDTALGQIFNTWSTTNASQAAAAISSLPMGSAQTVATTAVAKNFAKGDLAAAIQWTEGLSGPVQLAAAREIVNLWSGTDPQSTAAWIMGQNSPQLRGEALRQLAGNWASRDPGAAFDFAKSVSDPALRSSYIQSAMQRFSSMDPVAAANWLSSDVARPQADSLVGSVSARWAAFDPGAAAGWASSITDTALRDKALAAVSKSWSQTNPDKAAQWIGSLGDMQRRDVATAAFSVEMAKANPAVAAQWATRISDPAKLGSSLSRIVGDWKKIDPNAARAFVISSPAMPPDLKQRLLR